MWFNRMLTVSMMIWPLHVTLLLTVVFLFLLPSCSSEEYYVTPTPPPNPACPSGKPCHTLNYYAENVSSLLNGREVVSLLFMDGLHVLTGHHLEVSDTVNLSMSGVNTSIGLDRPPAAIQISDKVNITFNGVSNVRVQFLSIVNFFYDPDTEFGNVTFLVRNFRRFFQSHLKVTNGSFVTVTTNVSEVHMYETVYTNTSLTLSDSKKDNASNTAISLYLRESRLFGSQLSIKAEKTELLKLGVILDSCTLNSSLVNMQQFGQFNIVMSVIYSSLYNVELSGELDNAIVPIPHKEVIQTFELHVEHCNLTQLLVDEFYPATPVSKVSMEYLDCRIFNSTLQSIANSFFTNVSIVDSYMHYCILSLMPYKDNAPDNRAVLILTNVTYEYGLNLEVTGPANMTIDGCSFLSYRGQNSLSPFLISNVNVFFSGNTLFANSMGYRGGAFALAQSTLYLNRGANITFLNNTAVDVGGAIYVYTERIDNSIFQLTYNLKNEHSLESFVYFINNSALNGGMNMFGVSPRGTDDVTPDQLTMSYEIQNELFHFDEKSILSLSSVTSDPKRICLCKNGIPQCDDYSYIVLEKNCTSGEKFNLSLAVVGDDFGIVTGGMYAILNTTDKRVVLGPGQNLQLVGNKCSQFEYSVHSKDENEGIVMFLVTDALNLFTSGFDTYSDLNDSIRVYNIQNAIEDMLLSTPIYLNITIQKCPLGLGLSGDPPTCQCIRQLANCGNITCAVKNGTGLVYRSGTVWVSHSGSENNETDGVLVHKYCPYNYCKVDIVSVDLYQPDSQCAFNHSGILCGGCPSNLSLALGSSQCLPCTDDGHVALLFVFVVAGIVLVLFIKLLDLTVAKGVINGLILYANIVWINQSLFFPSTGQDVSQTVKVVLQVLKVFIAWLNLDFGIETCFYQGLDAYWKTWLQFVFPLYVWMLAGGIIMACRYSNKATKLFGNNSVHVLATLVLISYVKLLRTIITSLGFVILYYPQGTKIVWLFDGNVQYFGLRHSFLFVAAASVLLFLWLPYTATLLLVPCLRRNANFVCINKWKPFYDAYYGPLKDKHQYWVGVTLLVRVLLAVTGVAIQATAPMTNMLLVIIVSAILCFVVNPVYRNSYLSILEASFFLNLVVLSGGFLYSNNQDIRLALICTSTGISFITFLGTVIVKVYVGVNKGCYKCRAGVYDEYDDLDQARRVQQVTRTIVSMNSDTQFSESDQLREPLLDSVSRS